MDLKSLCEDFVSYEPLQYPCMLFGRVYECETLLTLIRNDQPFCPVTRRKFDYFDIMIAPTVIWDICAVVHQDEKFCPVRKAMLQKGFANYLYIVGNIRLAAEHGDERALVQMWMQSRNHDAELHFARKLAAKNECGYRLLGLSHLFRENLDEAETAFMMNWESLTYQFKGETAYFLGIVHYWKGSNTTKWARVAESRLFNNNDAKLLLAQIYFRKCVTRRHRTHCLWKLVLKTLDTIDTSYSYNQNDTRFIRCIAMIYRKDRYKSIPSSKSDGYAELRLMASIGHLPSREFIDQHEFKSYGPRVFSFEPYLGI